jgi:hypothetical protein
MMKHFLNRHDNEIAAALGNVQAGCKARLMRLQDIKDWLAYALKGTILSEIPKTHQKGIKIEFTTEEDLPNTYGRKGKPQYTKVILERFASGWAVVEVSRMEAWQRKNVKSRFIYLKPEHEEVLIANLRKAYILVKPKTEESESCPS